ncbi:hypothetical protein [Sphingomonas lenta]|nr:hypothetical protein [Sphingomonas lenta]
MGRGLIARVLLLAGLAALLVFAARVTAGNVFAGRDPDFALRLSPGNARALGEKARKRIQTEQSPAARAEAMALAARALARDPGNVDAVVAAGLVKDLARRPAEAARLMRYSGKLSRRDFATRIWLIEDAVRRNDVEGALHHYDVALRTSRLAPSVLFPVLVQAVTGDDMIAPLSTTLARRPVWSYQFMQQLAQTGTDYRAMAALYEAVRRKGGLVPEPTIAAATARMVEAGAFGQAWSLYAGFNPGTPRAGVRNGDFARTEEAPTPFDWNLSQLPGLAAEPLGDNGGTLRFEATSGAGGVAARQLLLLAPGAHELSGTAYDVVLGGGGVSPSFRLVCAGGARVLSDAPLPSAASTGAAFRARFSVPSGCPAQWLELHVPSAEGPTPVSGSVGRVAVR